mmetsp:Transcript_19593/g.45560  ORF Transcript_19593/g.45560 Transcript_19593/m.45560 type:complete len:265 (-) Transcript_19593:145-939(-)
MSSTEHSAESKMPKMVPTGIPASTLEDPSNGSKTATYRPLFSMRISPEKMAFPKMLTGLSSSSLAIVDSWPLHRSARFSTSLAMTSSFFCSSPCTLIEPPPSSRPVRPEMALVFTRLLNVLHATWSEVKMLSISSRSGFARTNSFMYRLSVTPVSVQTSSCMGQCHRGIGVSNNESSESEPSLVASRTVEESSSFLRRGWFLVLLFPPVCPPPMLRKASATLKWKRRNDARWKQADDPINLMILWFRSGVVRTNWFTSNNDNRK